MVVFAVTCEPVSIENSRLLGNLIGKFDFLSRLQRARDEITGHDEMLMPKFPVQHNRELQWTNRDFRTPKRAAFEA